jgi:hypothetical protein
VNTTADDTTADSTLSLREAIEVSDGTLAVSSLSAQEQAQVSGSVGSSNTIKFKIPTTDPGYDSTTGVWTIIPKSNLPAVGTNAAVIDGYSQPGSSPNTLTHGDNATLKIALSGAGSFAFNGLTLAQPGSQVRGLVIENFSNDGVVITAAGGAQVAGCFLGADPTGESAALNQNGVEIDNSSNTIGGPNVGDRNVISENAPVGPGGGVYVPDKAHNPLGLIPTGNVIENNLIGLDAAGNKALGKGMGVEDHGSGDTYGGTSAGMGNVISGNSYGGIRCYASINIEGNEIGTNAAGDAALGNGASSAGIFFDQLAASPATMVISHNVVSGNATGIWLLPDPGSQTTYTITGNLVGTNAAGSAALGNTGDGLYLVSVQDATITGNVISGNDAGIFFQVPSTGPTQQLHDVVQGNRIGTDSSGQVALGNKHDGITIYSGSGITVGGAGAGQGNLIAFNGQDGIDLMDGGQDQFTQNSIHDNKSAGIYLVWGQNQNAAPPVLTSTASSGILSGTLTWAPNTSYVIEIYSSHALPTAGKEQGPTFVQDVTVTTDGSGKGSFAVPEPDGYYTATATDPNRNTSAFSNGVAVSALPASVTSVSSSANPSALGQSVTFTAVVTAPSFPGTPTGTVVFTIDGQAEAPAAISIVAGVAQAQFTTASLAAGAHTVSAAYSGETSLAPSHGSLPSQTVVGPTLTPTHIKVTSAPNPSTVGQAVTLTAVVAASASQGTPTGTVTFMIDGHPQSPVALAVAGGMDEAQFTTSALTAGTHEVKATYSGDSSFSGSALIDSYVIVVKPAEPGSGPPSTNPGGNPPPTDPPTVVSVNRFGIHMQPTVLVVTFSEGLDPATAQDPGNYKILDPSGRPVGIASAVYDASTRTVTLKLRGRINLHHTYTLTVMGDGTGCVADTRGVRLDGLDNGLPGSNYTTSLTWRNVVWPASPAGKSSHHRAARPAGALAHSFLVRRR